MAADAVVLSLPRLRAPRFASTASAACLQGFIATVDRASALIGAFAEYVPLKSGRACGAAGTAAVLAVSILFIHAREHTRARPRDN